MIMLVSYTENMKKLLILQASPRKGGNLYEMADSFAKDYAKKGYEVECVDMTQLKFHYCIACMKCRSSGKCIFDDDADTVGKKLESADLIVVASPVWWGGMPGHLKAFFDRNVFRMMSESSQGIPRPLMRGKKAILLAACTTPFPFNILCRQSTGLKHSLNEIFKTSGIKLVKVVCKAGTKK